MSPGSFVTVYVARYTETTWMGKAKMPLLDAWKALVALQSSYSCHSLLFVLGDGEPAWKLKIKQLMVEAEVAGRCPFKIKSQVLGRALGGLAGSLRVLQERFGGGQWAGCTSWNWVSRSPWGTAFTSPLRLPHLSREDEASPWAICWPTDDQQPLFSWPGS